MTYRITFAIDTSVSSGHAVVQKNNSIVDAVVTRWEVSIAEVPTGGADVDVKGFHPSHVEVTFHPIDIVVVVPI
jgi:hypothetical protein